MTATENTTLDRFWSKVQRGDGCWLWTSSLNQRGYGTFFPNGRSHKAHRLAWEFSNGPVANGLLVCHHCDNPRCVRPDHLFVGSHLENVQDMVRKNRHAGQRKTHCKRGHELSGSNLRPRKDGTRFCYICWRAGIKAWKERQRHAK